MGGRTRHRQDHFKLGLSRRQRNSLKAMADEDSELKVFNDFGIDEVILLASISRRMLQRLEEIHNANAASLAI
jgi:hypothetical protein